MSVTLKSSNAIAWSGDVPSGLNPHQVHFGPDPKGLGSFEIAIAVSDHSPSVTELKQLHKLRLQGRDTSLVVAVVHGETIWMFGPDTTLQPQKQAIDSATRHLQAALNEGDSLQATKRFLSLSDAQSQTQMPGVRNRGLFATYHLRENTKKRADWSKFKDDSARIIRSRSRQLIEDLGFVVTETANHTLVLNDSADATRAVALLLDESESFENESPRFHSSPVAWGLSIAAERGVPWLIMLRKEQIRLYPARDGVGVGQKGQTETYLELDLAGLGEEYMGLLTLIFSAEALGEKGSAQELLDESVRYATALGTRLRERIYERVVPDLAKAVALEMRKSGRELDATGLQDAYRATLRILFRLLFQAYAEDRGLLPAGRNTYFDEHSLTLFASQAVEIGSVYGSGTELWDKLQEVWEAIDVGNPDWRVPAYNGGLFGSDPELRPYGALIRGMSLPDSVIGPALEALLIDKTEDDVTGMVDFRSLSVREFGTIYEGLLESSLSVADTNLTLDANGTWLPAGEGDTVVAQAGEPYFHNTSGERKATGSYFTPDFIVDHLIERSIDPSLDDHLSRIKALIDEGKDNEAAKKFFDYRVADLAMGSAHFLVAAVDRIESKMRSFLAQPGQEIAGVSNELERLAEAARKALGDDLVAIDDIDDAVLLRRQIARRCVYGIDINPLAVELSRLALWIHTFVPGLPMSTLDHNIVSGNSLAGFGSIQAVERALGAGARADQLPLFDSSRFDSVERVREILEEVAALSEATQSEVKVAQEATDEARRVAEESIGIFNLALAVQSGHVATGLLLDEASAIELSKGDLVRKFVKSVDPVHFPVAFPEVFLRANPGFDAIVGNPPWEKLHVDTVRWWVDKFPALRAEKGKSRDNAIAELCDRHPDLLREVEGLVISTNFVKGVVSSFGWPGLGKSHIDLYQAFSWRNWELLRSLGKLGIVLPRGAMAGPAMQGWRSEILSSGSFETIVVAKNRGRWAFDGVAEQYTFVVAVIAKGKFGPFEITRTVDSKESFLSTGSSIGEIEPNELKKWSSVLSFPMFDYPPSIDVYRQLMKSSTISELIPRVKPRSEFNSTINKNLFHFEDGVPGDPVVAGRSFNLWNPEADKPYARIDRREAVGLLRGRRRTSAGDTDTDQGIGQVESASQYRVFFRDIARSTDPRTAIFSLLPPYHFSVEGSPYLEIQPYNPAFQAYLLGVVCSIPFDWAVRRWVELHLKFYIVNDMPVPNYSPGDVLHLEIAKVTTALVGDKENFSKWRSLVSEELGTSRREAYTDGLLEELDALVSLAYGLSRQQVEHIFETFHRGWDYAPRLSRVLEFYDEWKDRV